MSSELYGIDLWGEGYFRVNNNGNVVVSPAGDKGPSVDLLELTQDLLDRGIRVPIMIRFPDIIKSLVELINSCFAKAIQDHKYNGNYCGVYPIKVNQQKHLVEELVKHGKDRRTFAHRSRSRLRLTWWRFRRQSPHRHPSV